MPDDSLNLRAFKALCWSKAYRWKRGLIDWEDPADDVVGGAIDPLQRWADEHGLVDEIGGQDAVQAIMAEAFHD